MNQRSYSFEAKSRKQLSSTSGLHPTNDNGPLESPCQALLLLLNEVTLKLAETQDMDRISSSHSFPKAVTFLENLLLMQQNQLTSKELESESNLPALHEVLEVWAREYPDHRTGRSVNVLLRNLTPELLLHWIDYLTETIRLSPSSDTYRYLMDADLSNAPFVFRLFQRMQDSHSPDLVPTLSDFHRVISALASNRQPEQAESYLQRLIALHRSDPGNIEFRPTTLTYKKVILGYTQASRPSDATRVHQQLLDEGIAKPSEESFDICLNAWTKGRHESAGRQAENLVLQMQRLGFDPSRTRLAQVISAWVASRNLNAPERALAILELLLSLDDGNDKAVVDSYLKVLEAHSYKASRDHTAPEQCQALLECLVSSDIPLPETSVRQAIACVIRAWARSRRADALEEVEKLLSKMTQEYKVSPNLFVFNCVLDMYARDGHGSDALRLWKMLYVEFMQGRTSIQPTTVSVNLVLLAISRSATPLEADTFWKVVRRTSIPPNVTTFNILLSVLGKSTCLETARRGEAYVKECEQMFSAGHESCRPEAATYTKALELWLNVSSPESVKNAQKHWASLRRSKITPHKAAYDAYSSILKRNLHHGDAQE